MPSRITGQPCLRVPGIWGYQIHPVKEQTLALEHESIVIVRQKVPTPKGISGHLIRRTDSDAVSASSMFRSAFPGATELEEEREMEYLTSKHDTVTAGRENEEHGRLTGKVCHLSFPTGLLF